MATCVSDIYNALLDWAPLEYALEFDNPGHLVGDLNSQVDKVLIALDATSEVIDEAEKIGAQLIITHHPLIFDKLSRVVAHDLIGGRVYRLIKSGISLICMHTNLDSAAGGVNDILAHKIALTGCHVLDVSGSDENGEYGIGRVGELDCAMDEAEFLAHVKKSLGAAGLRYASGGAGKIKKVAVGGGSCGSYLEKVKRLGCDAFVTADIKHDGFLNAKELGICLVDAGHFTTENPICAELESYVSIKFPGLEVHASKVHTCAEEFYTE